MPDPEHPCARHLSWPAVLGMVTTGAALGWATAALTIGAP